jgi:nitrite reductase/ring-hydroxylating ferredoxin subunit
MDLPQPVTAIGEQLESGAEIAADPALLTDAAVFAAERQKLFLQPWVAIDHHSRLPRAGRFIRLEAPTRSLLLTRDGEGQLRALRNLCLHSGYPVCEAVEGPAERLVCPYHGWEYTAAGRLVEPDLSHRMAPERLHLQSHPVSVQDGLIFVDLSRSAFDAPELGEPCTAGALPDWLADAEVARRMRYNTEWNWKLALRFLKSSPHLIRDDDSEPDDAVDFGPLSFMLVEPHQATLLGVIPRSAAASDIALVRMAAPGTKIKSGPDRLARGLRDAGDAAVVAEQSPLDRDFLGWYWSLMSAA